MTERSYQDAVQVLKDHLGGRWEGIETDGRDEMVSMLKKELGYDSRAANDSIDAMIDSGALRYHRISEEAAGDLPLPVAPVSLGGTTGGLAGMPPVPLATGPGYWQIGDSQGGDSDALGRKGQVTPR